MSTGMMLWIIFIMMQELLDELSAFNNAGHVKRENIDTCSYLRTILSSIKPYSGLSGDHT